MTSSERVLREGRRREIKRLTSVAWCVGEMHEVCAGGGKTFEDDETMCAESLMSQTARNSSSRDRAL